MNIRLMEEKDLMQVIQIENELFSDAWSLEGFRESLARPEARFFVAEDSQAGIVGYCGSYRALDEAEIVNVAVRRDYQNRGCGHLLVEALMDAETSEGARHFILEVRAGNGAAQHLYTQLGFEVIGVRKRFYDKPVEDALIMQKNIHN